MVEVTRSSHRLVGDLLELRARNPFQPTGAIHAEAHRFVGRRQEIQFVQSHLRGHSVLVLGRRSIGKTSLLKRVYAWGQEQEDLVPILVDFATVHNRQAFERVLGSACRQLPREHRPLEATEGRVRLSDLVDRLHRGGRLPILIFDEIDGLVGSDLFEEWKTLDSRGQARFALSGCTIIAEICQEAGLLDFTIGPELGGRAVVPTFLSTQEASELLGLLTDEMSQLEWRSSELEQWAARQILACSCRIPWVLQTIASKLWNHMYTRAHRVIERHDVELVLQRYSDEALRIMENVSHHEIGVPSGETRAHLLLLYCTVIDKYFRPGLETWLADAHEGARTPDESLVFEASEAPKIVFETLSRHGDRALAIRASDELEKIDVCKALRRLTLTLSLARVPGTKERYWFPEHFFPTRLRRVVGNGCPFDKLEHEVFQHRIVGHQLISLLEVDG